MVLHQPRRRVHFSAVDSVIAEQEAIADAVEDQLSVVDHLEADLEAKLKSAQSLRQSTYVMRSKASSCLRIRPTNPRPNCSSGSPSSEGGKPHGIQSQGVEAPSEDQARLTWG